MKSVFGMIGDICVIPPKKEKGAWIAKVNFIDGQTKTGVGANKFEAIGQALYWAVPSPVKESPTFAYREETP